MSSESIRHEVGAKIMFGHYLKFFNFLWKLKVLHIG